MNQSKWGRAKSNASNPSLYDKDGKLKVENLHVEEEKKFIEDEIESSTLISEILLAISETKKGKVMSVDAIPAEMLKSRRERERYKYGKLYCMNLRET